MADTARWQLLGQRGGAGGDEILSNVEAFPGIGFYAGLPSSGGKPEAIGVGVGGTRTTAIIAARDEATRQAVIGSLPMDSTAVFNTQGRRRDQPGRTVEIRLAGGAARHAGRRPGACQLCAEDDAASVGRHRGPAGAELAPDADRDDRAARAVAVARFRL